MRVPSRQDGGGSRKAPTPPSRCSEVWLSRSAGGREIRRFKSCHLDHHRRDLPPCKSISPTGVERRESPREDGDLDGGHPSGGIGAKWSRPGSVTPRLASSSLVCHPINRAVADTAAQWPRSRKARHLTVYQGEAGAVPVVAAILGR